jgi:hypothetical protein
MVYIDCFMSEAATIGIRALEALFFGGLAGSFILVVVTAVEDIETVLGRGESDSAAERGEQS